MAVGIGSTGLKTGFGDGFGAALIVTPLFQTSFVPDLMQVNFLPEAVAVAPALVHLAPALGVAACTGPARVSSTAIAIARRPLCCINCYLQSIEDADCCGCSCSDEEDCKRYPAKNSVGGDLVVL